MNTHSAGFFGVAKGDVAWLGTEPVPAAPYYDPAFHGQHRTQTIWSNPAPPPPAPTLALAYGRESALMRERGVAVTAGAREYFALFPNFFMLGSPVQHFSHVVMPISATRSRGVIRSYWIGEGGSATERFARAHIAMAVEVQCEDEATHARLRAHMTILRAPADAPR